MSADGASIGTGRAVTRFRKRATALSCLVVALEYGPLDTAGPCAAPRPNRASPLVGRDTIAGSDFMLDVRRDVLDDATPVRSCADRNLSGVVAAKCGVRAGYIGFHDPDCVSKDGRGGASGADAGVVTPMLLVRSPFSRIGVIAGTVDTRSMVAKGERGERGSDYTGGGGGEAPEGGVVVAGQ